ncbi:MAG: tetratricopeptide repeat protein [Bryobacterales bacterium]
MRSGHRSTPRLLLAAALLALVFALAGCLRSPEEKYAEFMKSGQQYMEQQDYASAVLQFRNAIQVMPENAEAHYQAALAELRRGRGSPAYQLSKKAEQLDPGHKENQMLLAQLVLLISQQEPEFVGQAESRLEKLRTANPQDANVLYMLAATKARVGNSEEMEELLMEALQTSPQHLQSSLALAQAKLAERDFNGAEQVLKKAVTDAPDSVHPKLALGQLYLMLNRPEDARGQFSKVLETDPQSAQAMVGLALMAEREGDTAEAERLMQKVSSLEDKRYKPFYGRLLLQHEKWGPAVDEFKRLVSADPRNADLRGLLLMAYLRADRAPEAEAFLKQAVADYPEDRVARKQLVGLLVSLTRSTEAEAILDAAIKTNPKDVDALLQRAEIYWRSGRIQQVDQDLANVLQVRPNSHEAHFLQAKLHQSRNQARLYLQELRTSIEHEPNFLIGRLELAEALRASGDAKGALTLLDEAPEPNRRVLAYTVARNWALIQTANPEARKMVDAALKVSQAPEILLQDGALKLAQGQNAAGRASFESALQQDPQNTRALGALAQSYIAEKQMGRATEVIKKYVSEAPKSLEMQNFMGSWFSRTGYRTEARQAYQAALAIDPNYIPSRLALAQLEMAEGNAAAAREGFKAVLAAEPTHVSALVYLGMVEDGEKNYDAAIASYQKALSLSPEGPMAVVALNNLAYRLSETRNALDEALNHAQRAKELAPENRQIDDTLGWIYYRKGIYPAALDYLESAASSDSGKKSALIQYHLALCQIKSGDAARGRQTLALAKSLDPKLPEAAEADGLLQQLAGQ